jgi:hypothetical protein
LFCHYLLILLLLLTFLDDNDVDDVNGRVRVDDDCEMVVVGLLIGTLGLFPLWLWLWLWLFAL